MNLKTKKNGNGNENENENEMWQIDTTTYVAGGSREQLSDCQSVRLLERERKRVELDIA